MKKRFLVYSLLCLLLTQVSCAKSNPPPSTIEPPPSATVTTENPPKDVLAQSEESVHETPDISVMEEETAEVNLPVAFTPPDLDKYKDNARYYTMLANLEALGKGNPVIVTRETYGMFGIEEVNSLAEAKETFSGLLEKDLRKLDLTDSLAELKEIDFDTETLWPDRLPDGFDPVAILTQGKNPGLGIKSLHENGLTGQGVSIAIVDQSLNVAHNEYKDQIMLYEKIHAGENYSAMHGSAVTSLAVGKTVGVAPDAKVYYIAAWFGELTEDGEFIADVGVMADCIDRVLEINTYLPETEKIKVVSISRGILPQDTGYDAYLAALDRAKDAGVLVITVNSLATMYDFEFVGLSRENGTDPEDFQSYGPTPWVRDFFYEQPTIFDNTVLVPMGNRTYAGHRGVDYYETSYEGGMSWAVPWMAGFYALCLQAKPDVTPEEFLHACQATGVTIDHAANDTVYKLGKIINPSAVIEALINQ